VKTRNIGQWDPVTHIWDTPNPCLLVSYSRVGHLLLKCGWSLWFLTSGIQPMGNVTSVAMVSNVLLTPCKMTNFLGGFGEARYCVVNVHYGEECIARIWGSPLVRRTWDLWLKTENNWTLWFNFAFCCCGKTLAQNDLRTKGFISSYILHQGKPG